LETIDVYVQPSWCEAHPLSLLEAGALEIPVVATRIGGMPESLDDGRAGLIVPARNPEALARAIIQLLGSTELRRTTGHALGERVRARYTNERMVAVTTALYDDLLASDHRKGRR
jgi:glycosyltransferase involved in cell wall biosynthesis